MTKVDLLIFDFDGTLADTGADLAASINHTLTALRMDPRPLREILGFVGDGVRMLMERSLGENHKERLDEAMHVFIRHYEEHLLDRTVLYPRVEEVLKYFHSKKKVILTNKRYYLTLAIARGLGIDGYFTEIAGADSTPFQKPDRRTVDYLLAKHHAAAEKTVIIGDGVNDVTVAKNAGILSCAHLNGLGSREALRKMEADFYYEHLVEIETLFQ